MTAPEMLCPICQSLVHVRGDVAPAALARRKALTTHLATVWHEPLDLAHYAALYLLGERAA